MTGAALALLLQAAAWQVEAWQPAPVSSPAFESHPAFDGRGRALYFVRSSARFTGWRLQVSHCRGGRWTEPAEPAFAGDGAEADPFVTADGGALYFISSRSEDGVPQSELDIWRVTRRRDGNWGAPERLPEPINSAGNEWFPRLAHDGRLYFGSDRPGGLGGTDIWRARQRGGRWTVENLGPGVNGPGDEYEAEISRDGRRMLLMAGGDLWTVPRSGGGWGARIRLGPEINGARLEAGPLLAPDGRSFLLARDTGAGGSGELFLARSGRGRFWPPRCR
ncbi:MAG: hypothetical protein QOI38_2569 [Sphingomonadales bacterium]|jgi:hypothetical protein|nr:hypothetical protein [Sphingomonadales bacterium]